MIKIFNIFLVLTAFSMIFNNCGKINSEKNFLKPVNLYLGKKIFCSMAGSGDPWSALTREKRPLILAMYDGNSLEQLSVIFNKTEEQMKVEIQPLIENNLVNLGDGVYKPDFFISGIDETEKVVLHSKATGEELAEELLKYRDTLDKTFAELSVSENFTLKELGFVLVGSRLLDMGVIGSLVRDGSLIGPAPFRPGPERPDAQYYFWMVEGEPRQLGKYGQEDTDLSWENWHLLDFGATYLHGVVNFSRRYFVKTSSEIIKSGVADSPSNLAEKLKIPYLTKDDSLKWEKVVRDISDKLQIKLREKESDFRTFYNTLKSSKYANNSFSEFFCWYYHLAYARAVDVLGERDLINIPPEGHTAIVMYFEGRQGFLTGGLK